MTLMQSLGVLTAVASTLALACGGGSSDGPSDTASEFYARLEKFDTAGMVELICADDREAAESGIDLLRAAIGVGSLTGTEITELELADFEARTVDETNDEATVRVTGRLLVGPPVGSTSLDEELKLRRESGSWCLAFPAVLAPTPEPEPSVAEFAGDPLPGVPGAVMYLEAPASQTLSRDEFTVSVNIRDIDNLGAFLFVLETGSEDLSVVDVRESDFLGSSGREVSCDPPTIQDSAARFFCVTLREAPIGPSGSGELAVITFKTESTGEYALTVTRAQVTKPSGDALDLVASVGGTVTIR